jgi:hypothetical protein
VPEKKSQNKSRRGGFPIDKYAKMYYIKGRWKREINSGSHRRGFKRNGPIKPLYPFS